MLVVKDNFLQDNVFELLTCQFQNKINLNALHQTKSWMEFKNYDEADVSKIKSDLGIAVYITLINIQKFFKEELQLNANPFSIRFQSTVPGYISHTHKDGSVRNYPLESSYTSILYTHKDWSPETGMNFYTDTQEIIPFSNRLLIYSRDIAHGVNEAKIDSGQIRNVFLISWSVDKVVN
jgi:hypothetical protein